MTQGRVRAHLSFFHLAHGIHRVVVVAFLVLCGGVRVMEWTPSSGPTLLAGVLLATHLFTTAPDQAFYYLAGTRLRLGQTGCLQ